MLFWKRRGVNCVVCVQDQQVVWGVVLASVEVARKRGCRGD
jgi:hypothetical protein